jgi:CSLREA domain-containing protein
MSQLSQRFSQPRVRRIVLGVAALAALLLAFLPVHLARGALITPTTTTDEFTNNTTCSLREALYAANNNTNSHEDACVAGSNVFTDTVTLANGATYPMNIVGSGEFSGTQGDFNISNNTAIQDLNINVAGGGTATIDQNTADRVFNVDGWLQITGVTVNTATYGG